MKQCVFTCQRMNCMIGTKYMKQNKKEEIFFLHAKRLYLNVV